MKGVFGIKKARKKNTYNMVLLPMQAAVSVRRMERYLNADELDPLAVTAEPHESM